MITISEDIWLNHDLGILDKVILVEFNRCKYTIMNEEVFGHILVFTRCEYKNVARSINRLIDLGLVSGDKVYEPPKKNAEDESKKDGITPLVNESDELDGFIQKFKTTIDDKYKECSKTKTVVIAEDALKLVIYCFKNSSRKKELFNTISKENLIAIYEEAISIQMKKKDNALKVNPFASITSLINKSFQ